MWKAGMSAQNFVGIHPVDAEIFYWTIENFDLLEAKDKKSEDYLSH